MGNHKVNFSYLQFVYDTLILMEGEQDKVMIFKSIINCFELVSGFKVNRAKSQLLTISFSESESSSMTYLLGCSYKGRAIEYLGLPFGGSPQCRHFSDPVVDRCRKRVTRWKADYLSFRGRVTLIKDTF